MHKVESCCCGCSLRTGTLILLIVPLVLQSFSLIGALTGSTQPQPGGKSTNVVGVVIMICILGAGVFGVIKKKPVWLIPFLTLELLGLVAIVLTMIALAIMGPTVIAYLQGMADSSTQKKTDEATGAIIGSIVIAEIMFAIAFAITYYFFVVVLSYFKQLRAEPRG